MVKILKAVKKVLKVAGVPKKELTPILEIIKLTILDMVKNNESSEFITETVIGIMDHIIEDKKRKGPKMGKKKFKESVEIKDEDIKYFKDNGDTFFRVGKHIVVKRYFLPASEFTDGVTPDEGFCFVLATKKDEKRFLKIAARQNIEVYRVDLTYLDDFVTEEMETYITMDFSDKKKNPLNILHKKCTGANISDMAKVKRG